MEHPFGEAFPNSEDIENLKAKVEFAETAAGFYFKECKAKDKLIEALDEAIKRFQAECETKEKLIEALDKKIERIQGECETKDKVIEAQDKTIEIFQVRIRRLRGWNDDGSEKAKKAPSKPFAKGRQSRREADDEDAERGPMA